jgi:hypothetical protein
MEWLGEYWLGSGGTLLLHLEGGDPSDPVAKGVILDEAERLALVLPQERIGEEPAGR